MQWDGGNVLLKDGTNILKSISRRKIKAAEEELGFMDKYTRKLFPEK